MKKYSKFVLILLFSVTFLSCGGDIIIVVDEYNSPYAINAYAGSASGTIIVEFVSGVTASDFEGFNFYANTTENFTLYDDAIRNENGGLPTYPEEPHSRQSFTIEIPDSFTPGTYYVSVTAFGLNELAPDGRIETAISTIVQVTLN